jgi:hypothetical protein
MRRGVMEQMVSLISLGDGSTLSLDFTTGVLDPRLTFTRSTTGTFINSSGYVTSAAINAPRFDYDPTTLQPRGLLIEGSATNLARRSDDFNTTVTDGTQWVAAGYTAGTLSTTLPDGTTGNARRISIASGSGSFRSADITVTASTAYTFSFWARNNGGSQARFRVWNVTAGSSIVDYTQSVNNYVSQIGGANNTSSTWVRVSVQFTTPAGCTAIYVYPTSSDSGTVDLLVWGAQVETGFGASAYIPTGASTATRNADSCVMTGTNFSSWFAGATEGVLYAECERPTKIPSPATDHAIVGTRYANGQGLWIYASATNQYPSAYIFPTGGAQFAGGIATRISLINKQAVRWFDGNDITNFGNGTQGTTNTAGTGTMVPTMLTIGANSTSGTEGNLEWLNGCIRRVKFWPTALPNAQIIALTT